MQLPSTLFFALIAGVIPAIIWLSFWLREDDHPEPRSLLAASFFAGILSVVAAIVLERFFDELVLNVNIKYGVWAAIEEIVKFVAVALIALNTRFNDEPIDAMIYTIAVALGFSALENTLFILDPFLRGEFLGGIMTGNMRFIGATLVHIVSSAAVGFALGFTFYKSILAKTIALVIGLSVAIAFHTAFNLSIVAMSESTNVLSVFAWVWSAVILLIVLFEEVKVVKPSTS